MADYSQYKNLELPKSNEHYDVGVANKNNMVIDSELHKLDLKNQSQDELLATKEALNSEISRATAHENEILTNLNIEITRATSVENQLSNNIENEANRAIIIENLISENLTDHESSTSAHNDIRDLITELTTRLNVLADSDDETLDQLSEIVSYIKNHKSLIDGITTSKINVSDIIDNINTVQENTVPGKIVDSLVIKEFFQSLNMLIDNITPEIIGAASEEHTHGDMKTITFATSEPDIVAENEIVMVYETE